MVTRRQCLAAISGGVAVTLAGCGFLSDSFEGEASPAAVSESARTAAGFTGEQMEQTTYEQSQEVAGEERDISLTNWTTEYRKQPAADDVGASGFVIFSSPTVSIADRSFNPFDQFGEKRLIEAVLSRSNQGGAGNLNEVGEQDIPVLENSVTFTEYESTQSVGGQDVDVRIHIGTLTHEGDVLVVLGVYPEALSESESIRQMAEGIEHPVEPN